MTQADLLRLAFSLILVVALILFAAWVARRSGFVRPKNQKIHILASQSLGARNSIIVVEIEKQKLVLGVSPQHIQLLHVLPPTTSEFDSQLQTALSAHSSRHDSPTS